MNRINELISLINKPISTLIDIGADHGYLGIKLLKDKKVKRVINIEISPAALDSCYYNYKKQNLSTFAEFLLSDGFSKLKKIPDNSFVVIAGLGNKTIMNILKQEIPQNIENMMFLSHTFPISIREWAYNNKWSIEEEKYFEDNNKIYLIIKIIKIEEKIKPTTFNIFFGKKEFFESNKKLSTLYWLKLKTQIEKIPNEYRKSWEREFLVLWSEFIQDKSLRLSPIRH